MKLINHSFLLIISILTVGCGAGTEFGVNKLGFEGEAQEFAQEAFQGGLESPDNTDSGSIVDSETEEGVVINPIFPGNVVVVEAQPSGNGVFQGPIVDIGVAEKPWDPSTTLSAGNDGNQDEIWVSGNISIAYEPSEEPIELEDLDISATAEPDNRLDNLTLGSRFKAEIEDDEPGEDNSDDDD